VFQDINWRYFAVSMLVLVVSLTVHELAHAKSAERAGDDTARRAGRISINPLDHLDPMGTVMMILSSLSGFGIGWAKPVPINPYKFHHPRWDNLKVSLWGPLSNLLLAFAAAQVLRFGQGHLTGIDAVIAVLFVVINLALAIFNLIPIAPLDGSHILSALLPIDQARRYDIFMGRYGFMILLALVFIGPMTHVDLLEMVLLPPTRLLFHLFTGIPF